ncbi:MAG: pyrroloquinoline quinone biosynthesis protein PqqE [Deltaproteobacteria bacterium]|nr:MAG: pyrroloquinoline quinone biosynthesis protein PqqE [Deltaproteobacteria bacterium]
MSRPYVLVAELTYRCPLRCAYCSNPTEVPDRPALATADWQRVLGEAGELGVVQVHFTGGEPLLRDDLEALVARAAELELYSNLITSGMPLTRERLAGLAAVGLCALQLSFQAARPGSSAAIAGVDAFAHKRQVAAWTRELELPLTVNVVLHRQNLDEVGAIIALAEELGAERLELANTQYLGWAHRNRAALMPDRAQLDAARAVVAAARARLRGRMELLFVLPDYPADRPRTCMNGWGERYVVVTPDGRAMPCHAAHILPLAFPDLRACSLASAWNDSDAFQRYRGTDYLREPCRSCDQREVDHGGCRCQAFLLTGDATAADPVCDLSPHHDLVVAARAAAADTAPPLTLRRLRLAR